MTMLVTIPAGILAPVPWNAVCEGPDTRPGNRGDEYVLRLTDGRTVALRATEFVPRTV